MSEKKRYGMLEMDEAQKKRLEKVLAKKPLHKVDPEIREMILEKRKGMPRIIDIHTHAWPDKISQKAREALAKQAYLYTRNQKEVLALANVANTLESIPGQVGAVTDLLLP